MCQIRGAPLFCFRATHRTVDQCPAWLSCANVGGGLVNRPAASNPMYANSLLLGCSISLVQSKVLVRGGACLTLYINCLLGNFTRGRVASLSSEKFSAGGAKSSMPSSSVVASTAVQCPLHRTAQSAASEPHYRSCPRNVS